MGEEIVLEVIDKRHRLIEELAIGAAVHEDSLCAEHLGHFGEDGGATLCYEVVREYAQEGVGGDAGETVRAAAFQAYAQFREWALGALVLLREGV